MAGMKILDGQVMKKVIPKGKRRGV